MKNEPIKVLTTVSVRPWMAPNYATLITGPDTNTQVSVQELGVEALDEMAAAWLADLYKRAGKPSPFELVGR